ncbi:hypothetical protein AB6N01_10960 [Alcaligenes nematophilus]|uniref:hypothetical protein n=1 Tax=Alcaligenes TaxID=507 RepID=UPI00129365AA|nr:hypothetical protein [Alcaligenes faecalis]MBX6965071.1 hypothetical protein [Providencia rettgeri]MBX7031635.1 hypothetical protein [Alcaligenes faecalis]QFY79159.1 hypothetical protein DUD43_16395 [Alcaligenes faecalis]
MSFTKISPLRSLTLLSVVLLAACAQAPVQPAPNEGRDSTQKDALRQAQGSGNARAPSQINLGFGNQEGLHAITPARAEQPAAQADRSVPELAEPKTFLGTLSCPPQSGACEPYKISVTLAPAGQWRMRATPVGAGQEHHKSGCWVPIGTQPTRIALLAENDSTLADLSFVNNNVLRINTFNQQRPTLESHMTRQADLDPVNELDGKATPACR